MINEDIGLSAGQEVIVTILDTQSVPEKKIDLKKYMGRGEKMFHSDAQDYIREMRGIPDLSIQNREHGENKCFL